MAVQVSTIWTGKKNRIYTHPLALRQREEGVCDNVSLSPLSPLRFFETRKPLAVGVGPSPGVCAVPSRSPTPRLSSHSWTGLNPGPISVSRERGGVADPCPLPNLPSQVKT